MQFLILFRRAFEVERCRALAGRKAVSAVAGGCGEVETVAPEGFPGAGDHCVKGAEVLIPVVLGRRGSD